MLEVIQVGESEWQEISTNGINTHVLLCHIECLYLKLEETIQQSPLDDVLEKYRVPLSESQLSSLGELVTQGDKKLPCIPKVLQDFLTDQLTEDRWDEGASLKEYLTYTNGFF